MHCDRLIIFQPLNLRSADTEEDIKRITGEELDKLRAIRDRFIAEHDLKVQDGQ